MEVSEILRFSFWAPFQHHYRSDIAHLHMMIFEIKRVGHSARILSIHVEEAQFSLYVHKGGLKSDSFFFTSCDFRGIG